MATIEQTRVLSTPKVLVDGRIIKVIPNSVKKTIGGETKIRAVSSGGGEVDIVAGVNAEELLSSVEFEIAVTAEMVDFARQQRDKANRAEFVTIRLVEQTDQYAFTQMFLQNKPDVEFKSEGSIKLEYMGKYQP